MSTATIKFNEAKQDLKRTLKRVAAPIECAVGGHDWHVYARGGLYRTWWECYHCDKGVTVYYDDLPKNWKRKK